MVVLDPEWASSSDGTGKRAEAKAVTAALLQQGAQLVDRWHLGSGVQCVVCPPDAAAGWMARGLHMVSPAWVLR